MDKATERQGIQMRSFQRFTRNLIKAAKQSGLNQDMLYTYMKHYVTEWEKIMKKEDKKKK